VKWATAGYVILGLGFVLLGLLNANWLLKADSQIQTIVPLPAQFLSIYPALQGDSGIHPNQIAGTITLVYPLLVGLLIIDTTISSKVRWLIFLAVLFCSGALLLTESRSGWIGTFGGLLFLLVVWSIVMDASRARLILRTVVGLLVTLALIFLIAVGPRQLQAIWLEPPSETIVGSFSTLNTRRDIWPWAIQTINDFPYSGIGLGSFRQAAKQLYPMPVSPQFDFAHAHNVFLQAAVDLGIPGLISYVAILLISVATAWNISKNDMVFRSISIGLLSSLVAFHIYGLADTLALGSKPAVLLWALLALLAVMARLR
jgi:O-antigen ligase